MGKQIEDHDIVQARIGHIIIQDLIYGPTALILRRLMVRSVLEGVIILASIDQHKLVVFDKDRCVISSWQRSHTSLILNQIDSDDVLPGL